MASSRKKALEANYLAQLESREEYRLKPHGLPDADGYQRFTYPKPGYMAFDPASQQLIPRRRLPKLPTSVSIPIDAGLSAENKTGEQPPPALKWLQKFPHATPLHTRWYGMRSMVESFNKVLKGARTRTSATPASARDAGSPSSTLFPPSWPSRRTFARLPSSSRKTPSDSSADRCLVPDDVRRRRALHLSDGSLPPARPSAVTTARAKSSITCLQKAPACPEAGIFAFAPDRDADRFAMGAINAKGRPDVPVGPAILRSFGAFHDPVSRKS